MSKVVTIPCPCCGDNIVMAPDNLFMGHAFECMGCHAQVAIATESRELTQEAYKRLKNIENEVKGVAQ